jgi:hypothetical protein
MTGPFWKDKVWLTLVLGPVAYMLMLRPLLGWPFDMIHAGRLYCQGLCLCVAIVSIFLPAIQRTRSESKISN